MWITSCSTRDLAGSSDRDPVRVVCHGRIDPNKGHEVAAAAMARLRRDGLPVELTVIGEVRTFGFSQADADDVRAELASAVGTADGTMLGWMPHAELADQLRQHDVACVLSRVDEPFGLVTLEAMASGCAIIATRKGGHTRGGRLRGRPRPGRVARRGGGRARGMGARPHANWRP